MKVILIGLFALCASCTTFTSCSSDDFNSEKVCSQLDINVNVNKMENTRAIIFDTMFGENERLGIFLRNLDGTPYGPQSSYDNVEYISKYTGIDQIWNGGPTYIEQEGKVVAYYPYSASVTNMVIPVETDSQTDYMYSKWVPETVTQARPKVNIHMFHGLAALRINVRRGVYTVSSTGTATCAITGLNVISAGLAKSANLNITNGTLSNITGSSSAFINNASYTLMNEGDMKTMYFTVVPTGSTADVTLNITVDGKVYTATATMSTPFKQGTIYTINVDIKDNPDSAVSVMETPWVGSLPICKTNNF